MVRKPSQIHSPFVPFDLHVDAFSGATTCIRVLWNQRLFFKLYCELILASQAISHGCLVTLPHPASKQLINVHLEVLRTCRPPLQSWWLASGSVERRTRGPPCRRSGGLPGRSVRRCGSIQGLRKVLCHESPLVTKRLRARTMSVHIPLARRPILHLVESQQDSWNMFSLILRSQHHFLNMFT